MTAGFKDHFSKDSDGYAQHRPTYPDALFRFLSSTTTAHDSAWDCATGSGQVAVALAADFSNVVASDASQAQIDAAVSHPKVDYHVARAEQSGLADQSQNLVCVGQALHWFDEDAFMAEAGRVLKTDGVLAVWCYEICTVNAECDGIIDGFYRQTVGEYWAPERVTIEEGYANVKMPGEEIPVPPLDMRLDWSANDMLGYLRTWSACKRYEAERDSDPVDLIAFQLAAAWGDGLRRVVWPLRIKASRPNTLLE